MPLPLILLPALVAQAPATPPVLGEVQHLVEAIPEAYISGRTGAMPGLVARAQRAWALAKPEAGKALPQPELIAFERQLKAMGTMKPREQAVGALGLSSTLGRFQPRFGREDLLRADRAAKLAWCSVDAGAWPQVSGIAGVFQPLLDQDGGRHPGAVKSGREALKRFEESRAKRHGADAKRALKGLLELVDALEKP